MAAIDWAKKEVELAKAAKPDDDYGNLCIDAAYKLLEVFAEQGHSGVSAPYTVMYFKRLTEHKPLTPITEEDSFSESGQCERCSSLFKNFHPITGEIYYNDVDRACGVDINAELRFTFGSQFINNVVNKLYPITLPYMPEDRRYFVEIERTDRGDHALSVRTPTGDKIPIDIWEGDV